MIDQTSFLPNKDKIKQNYEAYKDYFAEIMQNIITVLKDNVKVSSQPTYKSRVKSFPSYYKKVLRVKPKETTNFDTLIYLTDMMGIRMICAFLEDINYGVNQIKNLFEIKEIEVKGAEKKISEFGYESIHVLIKIPESCMPKFEGKFEGLKPLSDELVCEIQIRTILQDAWAEVEHELIYKTEFNPFDTPLRRKLASLNASLTLADITFQEIRDYQKKLQKEIEDRRQTFYKIADNLLDEKPANEEKPVENVLPFQQGTIDDMLLHAIHAHNEGNLDEAIKTYTKILEALTEKDVNVNAVIRKHRGMAYFAMNKFDEALLDFEESLKYLQDSIKRYVKNSEVSFYKAEKRPSGADEVVEFLQKIQEQSKQLLENKNLSANYL